MSYSDCNFSDAANGDTNVGHIVRLREIVDQLSNSMLNDYNMISSLSDRILGSLDEKCREDESISSDSQLGKLEDSISSCRKLQKRIRDKILRLHDL